MPNPIHSDRYRIFREMLTEVRQKKGMLQSEVAILLNKNQSFVSKYERGERRLDFPEFLEVADALSININDFLKKYQARLASRN